MEQIIKQAETTLDVWRNVVKFRSPNPLQDSPQLEDTNGRPKLGIVSQYLLHHPEDKELFLPTKHLRPFWFPRPGTLGPISEARKEDSELIKSWIQIQHEQDQRSLQAAYLMAEDHLLKQVLKN